MVAAVAAALTVRVVSRRICFEVTIKQRPCTNRVRIIVFGTMIILINSAGTLTIIFRAGIGTGSRVRAVMAVLSVVQSVLRFIHVL